MKTKLFLLALVILMPFFNCYSQVEDTDGNKYNTVKIGEQVWMAENLNVSRFRNGDTIQEAKTTKEFLALTVKKIPCWMINTYNNKEGFNKYYNGYAVFDPRGLAPEGWDVPNNEDWTELMEFLGGKNKAGSSLKASNWTEYGSDYDNGNNKSGFSALPTGELKMQPPSIARFERVGISSGFWSKTPLGDGSGHYAGLGKSSSSLLISWARFTSKGYAVRCLKKEMVTQEVSFKNTAENEKNEKAIAEEDGQQKNDEKNVIKTLPKVNFKESVPKKGLVHQLWMENVNNEIIFISGDKKSKVTLDTDDEKVQTVADRYGDADKAVYLNGGRLSATYFTPQYGKEREFSLSFWLKMKDPIQKENHKQPLINDYRESQFSIGFNSSPYQDKGKNMLRFGCPFGGLTYEWQNLQPNGWNNIIINCDGSEIKLFINGEEKVKVSTNTNTIPIKSETLSFGSAYTSPRYPPLYKNFVIDDVLYYNRALSADEILFMAGKSNSMKDSESTSENYLTYKDPYTKKSFKYFKLNDNNYWLVEDMVKYGKNRLDFYDSKSACPAGFEIPTNDDFQFLNDWIKTQNWEKEDYEKWGIDPQKSQNYNYWTSDSDKYDDDKYMYAQLYFKTRLPNFRFGNSTVEDDTLYCRCFTQTDPEKIPALLIKKKQENAERLKAEQVRKKQELEDKAELEASRKIVNFDTLIDPRDNNRYKIIKVGTQWWFAENLRFKPPNYLNGRVPYNPNGTTALSRDNRSGFLYDYKEEYYHTFGVLYKSYIDPDYSKVSLCPDGWRIPSNADWLKLEKHLGLDASKDPATFAAYQTKNPTRNEVGKRLKEIGFNPQEGGMWWSSRGFEKKGMEGHYWTTTTDKRNLRTILRVFKYSSIEKEFAPESGELAAYCRCVKEED